MEKFDSRELTVTIPGPVYGIPYGSHPKDYDYLCDAVYYIAFGRHAEWNDTVRYSKYEDLALLFQTWKLVRMKLGEEGRPWPLK